MNVQSILKQLYKPIQPGAAIKQGSMHYAELFPDPRLQDFIYCYWHLKSTQITGEQVNYNVVADGCIDVFFELGKANQSYVMGFCNRHSTFALDSHSHYVGIRFLPSMFPQLFKIKASEITNRCENLELIDRNFAAFIRNQFFKDMQLEGIKAKLDAYFLSFLPKVVFQDDHRVYHALYLVMKNPATKGFERGLDTGVSPRQLRRLFEFYIGDTPKVFSRIVRFQHLLSYQPSKASLNQDKLFLNVGYYDQAHFVKEFNSLYGCSPNSAFQ